MAQSGSLDDESDIADGAPHPRFARVLIGQGAHEAALLDACRSGRLPHAIILGGPEGIGKATLAWRLAKFLLHNPPGTDLGPAADLSVPTASKAAAQVEALAHPDVTLLRREMNEKSKRFFTEIRADDVRRAIGLFQRAAGAGGYRICIVDSADDLNRSSANALLKMIEEPPPASLFLLVAHRPGLVLPTIRSRCRVIRLEPLPEADIARILRQLDAGANDAEIAAAAAAGQGSIKAALQILGHRGVELRSMVRRLLERLPAVDYRDVHKLAESVAGRDGEHAYETAIQTIFDWIAGTVRADAAAPARRLAPYAEVWEKVAEAARETDALNLDRRPLILSIFVDLAAAVRAASA